MSPDLERSATEVSACLSLNQALLSAVDICEADALREEVGGFLLHQQKTQTCKFVRVSNIHAGTGRAGGLYEAEREAFGRDVLALTLVDGWRVVASFHTHPTGCAARPSGTDLAFLFKGFRNNIIWSPSLGELNLFRRDASKDWEEIPVRLETPPLPVHEQPDLQSRHAFHVFNNLSAINSYVSTT